MISLAAKTTALVLIDLQKGIMAMPVGPHSWDDVITRSAALTKAFREKGGVVVLVNVAFSAGGVDRLTVPVDEPFQMSGPLPADWAVISPALGSAASDILITKRQWGAFFGTELDLQLRRRGVTTIVLGGVATNFGVESTAREAWSHNYAVVIAEDASASRSAQMHAFAVETIFPRIARVRKTAEILEGLT